MIYTGIGSRETPKDILWTMTRIGEGMAKRGHTLRSGRAEGADKAFENGFFLYQKQKQFYYKPSKADAELYVPQGTYLDNKVISLDSLPPLRLQRISKMVKHIHPNPDALTDYAMKLHMRNILQVMGTDLNTPTDFVIYWAKTDKNGIPQGGTRTAVVMAHQRNIPTINMADKDWNDQFKAILSKHTTK